MKIILELALCFFVFAVSTFGQAPPVAGRGPLMNVSLGFSNFNLGLPPAGRVSLNGLDASFTVDLFPRLGMTADIGYVRCPNMLGSGVHGSVLTYLGGPVFHVTRKKNYSLYVRGLAGGARASGAFPDPNGGVDVGYVARFVWGFGAGVEFRLSPSFAVRVSGDYLETYLNAYKPFQAQHNLRSAASLVYHFNANRR